MKFILTFFSQSLYFIHIFESAKLYNAHSSISKMALAFTLAQYKKKSVIITSPLQYGLIVSSLQCGLTVFNTTQPCHDS